MKKIVTLVLFSISFGMFSQIADIPENISPLLIGEKIPNISLRDVDGNEIKTNKIISKKTVLVFYRGGWCPYCNSQLADMQEIENQIIDLGYQVIAISPDAPSFLKQTEDKNLIALQNRQHNYYLNYKNKKKNIFIAEIISRKLVKKATNLYTSNNYTTLLFKQPWAYFSINPPKQIGYITLIGVQKNKQLIDISTIQPFSNSTINPIKFEGFWLVCQTANITMCFSKIS